MLSSDLHSLTSYLTTYEAHYFVLFLRSTGIFGINLQNCPTCAQLSWGHFDLCFTYFNCVISVSCKSNSMDIRCSIALFQKYNRNHRGTPAVHRDPRHPPLTCERVCSRCEEGAGGVSHNLLTSCSTTAGPPCYYWVNKVGGSLED